LLKALTLLLRTPTSRVEPLKLLLVLLLDASQAVRLLACVLPPPKLARERLALVLLAASLLVLHLSLVPKRVVLLALKLARECLALVLLAASLLILHLSLVPKRVVLLALKLARERLALVLLAASLLVPQHLLVQIPVTKLRCEWLRSYSRLCLEGFFLATLLLSCFIANSL
jgi:hypothetical protein